MSLFKFGDLEAEIDFTDVQFLENLDDAKEPIKKKQHMYLKLERPLRILFVHSVSVTLISSDQCNRRRST